MMKQNIPFPNCSKHIVGTGHALENFWNSWLIFPIFQIVTFHAVVKLPQTTHSQWIAFHIKILRIHLQNFSQQIANRVWHILIDCYLRNSTKLAALEIQLLNRLLHIFMGIISIEFIYPQCCIANNTEGVNSEYLCIRENILEVG